MKLSNQTSEFLIDPLIYDSIRSEEVKKRDELFLGIETAANQIIKSNFYAGLVYLFCMLFVLTSFYEPRPKDHALPLMIPVVVQ